MFADPEALYRQTTAASRALHESAVAVMPGGTTRTTTFFDPYPLYIERGEGCRVWDADGTERIDMLGNYTAMILGHAHPKVVEAIRKQAARGTGFAAANPIEVQLATLLCERVPSLDAVRFCNSGTEATMFAMRLARAFTGRPKIARMEGGYHGTHDYAEVISFRVDPGGAEQLYGVTPDLPTLGKISGGGLPVAAVGGRADVMDLLDPRREPNIAQGGTYNGNPLGMAAGYATMTELTPDVYEDLNRKGARVCEQLNEVLASHGVAVQVNGAGSMLALHVTSAPVVDYRTMAAANK